MGLLDSFFNTNTPDYAGLLGDTTDLRQRANTTGLVNMALGYLAAPKNQNLGLGRILAGSYIAGQQGAQGTYDNALNDWQTKQKIAEYQKQQAKQAGLDSAIATWGQPNSTTTTPDTIQNVPAPQGTDAPNFNTVQQTVKGTSTPTFDQSAWMKTVLPNLDAKDALAMLTKDEAKTYQKTDSGLIQMDAHGNPTGVVIPNGISESALLPYMHQTADQISRLNNPDANTVYNGKVSTNNSIRTQAGENARANKAEVNPWLSPDSPKLAKVASLQDIADTAKKQNKTTKQVTADLKAAGWKIGS